jgi:DNA repair ATPase RecN
MIPLIYQTVCQPVVDQFISICNRRIRQVSETIQNLSQEQTAIITTIALSAIGLLRALYARHFALSLLFAITTSLQVYFSSSVFNYQSLFDECTNLREEVKDRLRLQEELRVCSKSALTCTFKITSLEGKLVDFEKLKNQVAFLIKKLEVFETMHVVANIGQWMMDQQAQNAELSQQNQELKSQILALQKGVSSLESVTEKLGTATEQLDHATEKVEGLSTLADQLSSALSRLEQLEERLFLRQETKVNG